MMATQPTKAAKKTAKKAAKKTPGHHDPYKDARRTFEHLGRVQAIASLATQEGETLAFLTKTADAAFRAQQYKDSADLLRAAEHLSFASLHFGNVEQVTTQLRTVIEAEIEGLLRRADDHAGRHSAPEAVVQLLERMKQEGKASLTRGSLRSALEFARGAEALAHVDALSGLALPSAPVQKRLRGQ